jgi:hypothetical protein
MVKPRCIIKVSGEEGGYLVEEHHGELWERGWPECEIIRGDGGNGERTRRREKEREEEERGRRPNKYSM